MRITMADVTDDSAAGAAPVDAAQRQSSAHNGRPASNRDANWLNQGAGAEDGLGDAGARDFGTEPGKDNGGLSAKDREERLRTLKDRQNEERQKKLEELKQQALAAQKFREQKEEERRRRMDELRQRDTDRRHQVEERKRQIWEAERDRREAILRKNQEREARIDSKRKNERSQIVFAFGSSTPRMLEPADTGGSFWGTRRATSTTNVMMFTAAPLTRRASERELDGSKKRATSASGLDRKPGEDMKMSTSMYEVFHWNTTPEPLGRSTQRAKSIFGAPSSELGVPPRSQTTSAKPQVPTELTLSIDGHAHNFSSAPHTPSPRTVRIASIFGGSTGVGEEADGATSTSPGTMAYSASARVNRRKTDLMPTIPSPRDLTPTSSSRPSSVHLQQNRPFSRSPGLRSGEATPSPPSRPLSALSQQSVNSVNSGVNLRSRPVAAPRRPRPISIAVTGVSQETDMQMARAAHRHSIAGEIRAPKVEKEGAKPPLPKVHVAKKKPETPAKKPTDRIIKSAKASPRVTPKVTPLQSPGSEAPPSLEQDDAIKNEETRPEDLNQSSVEVEKTKESEPKVPEGGESQVNTEDYKAEPQEILVEPSNAEEITDVQESEVLQEPEVLQKFEALQKPQLVQKPEVIQKPELPQKSESLPKPEVPEVSDQHEQDVDMTASMIAKIRITTEGEAKAALAERRRLAREQAEREAELERLRLEEEERQEEERLRQEEEEQRRFEEEQLRLVEEARRAEDQRLLQAIEENERREEEERKRREEEVKAKAEKEEADKKAREEAERLRKEMDERLKKEEEERIARRKRVEAIMLRTRGKGATPTSTPTKGQHDGDGEGDEVKDESPLEESKPALGAESEDESNQASATDYHNSQSTLVEDTLVIGNIHQENGKVSNSELLLIDNSNIRPMEISEDLISSATSLLSPSQPPHSNGHRNGMDFVNVDNVKQNNTTNNLLDLSEFDAFSTNNVMLNASQQPITETTGEFEQILDLSMAPTTGKLANEDSVNSNVTSAPFIAFHDNLAKKQDNSSVTDLLS